MIHILLLILKIIGWILLVILGILILLTGIFLFVPVRYRGDVLGEGEWENLFALLKFSWLCSFVKGEVSYQGGALKWKFRIAWKQFLADQPEQAALPVSRAEEKNSQSRETLKSPPSEKSIQKKEPSEQLKKQPEPTQKKITEHKKTENKKKQDSRPGLGERISQKAEQIKCTFHKICDMLKSLAEKKERLMEFLTDEIHRSAFMKCLTELRRLFCFLKPSKCEADLEFGFSDPSVTGYVLAGASLIYPFIGECVEITPNFDEKVLKGNAMIKGRVHAVYFVIVLWNLLWNKNIRTTISHIRKLRF